MAPEGGTTMAMETIDLLETRLQRIEFYVTGAPSPQDLTQDPSTRKNQKPVHLRLQRIEDQLQRIAFSSQVVREVLELFISHPDLFPSVSATDEQASYSSLEQLAILQSCATLFPTTASRLTSIQDLPIPSAVLSADLISLHPRLAKVELVQHTQAQEVTDLRLRTASFLQRWYEISTLARGECWTEWDGRMMEVEKQLRGEEATRARDVLAI